MNRLTGWRLAALCALGLAWTAPASSQTFSDGTYTVEGGSYAIDVRREGANLVVVEPNKTSPYAPQADGSYHFYNPNTDTVYGIRVIDNQTIEAFKPHQAGNVPTRLMRVGGAPAAATSAPPSVPAASASAGAPDFRGLADSYMQRALNDADNVQSWTACAAAAKKRSLSTAADADAYAAKTAAMLKTILVDPTRSPCEDVISPTLWNAGGAAGAAPAAALPPRQELSAEEKSRLDALNARADERLEAGKAEAVRMEAEQQAYRQRVAEVKAAEQKFATDQAEFEAATARAKAAADAYERQMEAWRQAVKAGPSG